MPDDETLTKGERTRQVITEAAYALFLEQGFHGTTMRQIAQRAGLAPGSIYNHFSGKEAIFDTLILEKHPYRQILPLLQAAPGDRIEDFVRNAARSMVGELGRRPEFLKIMFIEIVEFNGSHIPLLVQTVYPQIFPLVKRFTSAEGALRELPVPLIFRAFIGLFFSYYITELMLGNVDLPGFRENSLDQFVDVFLHGILNKMETL